ncbi:MAG: penicillin-binding protein 2 [Betaproteobacteria bacterium]|nr:penicillin-binding protein 2 [Betaproteobacteria bacterium]
MFSRIADVQRLRMVLIGRIWFGVVLALALGALLGWRWYYLQIERFSHFSERASDNQITVQPLAPVRGRIFDRAGRVFADNDTRYFVKISSDYADSVMPHLPAIRTRLEIDDDGESRLAAAAGKSVYSGDIVVRDYMSENEVVRFVAIQHVYPQAVLDAGMYRTYPEGDTAAHVIGHVARISADDKKRLRERGLLRRYAGSQFIGRRGIEARFETRMHGLPGLREAFIDAHGRVLKAEQRAAPQSGEDMWLTIDLELQQLAEGLLAGREGAIVALDPHDGAIIALASSPRFDPNEFIGGVSQQRWDELNSKESGTPMVHRATYGQYAPGSTIKPFLALAALANGWRDADYSYLSKGFFALTPSVVFEDWKEGGHGPTDITKSIVRSVNSFYYQLAHDVGVDAMHDALAVFGFGQPAAADIGGGRTGVLPTELWKQETFGEQWYPGDTIPIGVGQGYLEVTPIQMARAMAVIANGGRLVQPYLATGIGNDRIMPPARGERLFESEHIRIITEALAQVTEPGGTAYSRVGKDSTYPIAGKTGTAQVTRLRFADGERVKNEELPEHLRDHAWFVGFAPAYNPRIVVATLVEHGGSGGRTAGPIARSVMDDYLLRVLGMRFVEEEGQDAQAASL